MSDRPILITGSTGQLGNALVTCAAAAGLQYAASDRSMLNFDKPATVERHFFRTEPSLVLNAAAWTDVNAAENNIEAAYRANRNGPAILAALCARAMIPLIHISTDYVFDGAKGVPYIETDTVAPLGIYGASKEAGERAVLQSDARAIVIRTAWLFSAGHRNFARTMIQAARNKPQLSIVADQRGTPTAAIDLATAVLHIVDMLRRRGWRDSDRGIFHIANRGDATWFEFAEQIFNVAEARGEARPKLLPITSADWPTPARRPADSRLDCTKLRQHFGIDLPNWRDATRRVITDMLATSDSHVSP